MDIHKIKIGDICDAYIEGEPTHRVIITSKNEDDGLVFGLDLDILDDAQIISINPEYEIENVIVNVNDL